MLSCSVTFPVIKTFSKRPLYYRTVTSNCKEHKICRRRGTGIYEKNLGGGEHPNTTAIYRNIGNVYRTQGKYNEALKWYEKTAKIREEIYGENHILTGYVYNDIGIVNYYQNKNYEALKDFHKALPIYINAKGYNSNATELLNYNIKEIYNSIVGSGVVYFVIIYFIIYFFAA